MSFFGGNSDTSLWSDVTSLFHNATTGELTTAQKTDIAQSAVNNYTPCANNPSDPSCGTLLAQVTADVNAAAPDTECVLNVPFVGCLAKSWSGLGLMIFAALALLWALSTVFKVEAYKALRA